MAAGIGVIPFVGNCVASACRDIKGIGSAAFMLVVPAAALALHILTYKLHSAG